MKVEIKVPEVGESITEGVLVAWAREEGELVAKDDPLFELETDKITLTVQAERAGRLSILVPAETTVNVGQVVGAIETDVAEAVPASAAAAPASPPAVAGPAPVPPAVAGPAPVPPAVAAPAVAAPAPVPPAVLDPLAPAVRRLVAEHGLDPRQIAGTGKDGRLTKEDVLRHLQQRGPMPAAAAGPAPAPAAAAGPTPAPAVAAPAVAAPAPAEQRTTRKPMSRLRQRIAQRLVEVQQSAAILTTFNEVDMTQVMELRKRFRESFQQRYDVRLGLMSFFIKAAVEALKHVPQVNAQIDGNDIVFNHFYDIGVAVGTEKGLVVPVIRDADKLGFAELELAIRDFALRARDRKLELGELSGGTFTISNGGVYGSMLSTPILNPPQSGILGLHSIKKRPVVVDDSIQIRPMMYLALSYDHRLVDGREAVTFLKRIVECIEQPERMMLEI